MSDSTFSLDKERQELALLSKKISGTSSYDGIMVKGEKNVIFLEFSTSSKDSSLKRVTALLRKLRNIPSEPLPQLLNEVQQNSLSMHFGEFCASILENRPKNSAEYMTIVRVLIHAMIESDDELRQLLCREILRSISTLIQNGLNPSDKTNFNAFKYFFRLACELQLAKVVDNKFNSLSTVLQKLVNLMVTKRLLKNLISFFSFLKKMKNRLN